MIPIIIFFFILFTGSLGQQNFSDSVNDLERSKRALSVFQVVRFPNAPCVSSTTFNGTCYTSSECLNKGGKNSGTCANGFGVCCTFTITCGGTASENCTIFQSPTPVTAGPCGVKICKSSPDICQIRLDFIDFVITGPETVANDITVALLNGRETVGGGVNAITKTRCSTDTFSLTGFASSPPVICGTNTGFHMYADANPSCNTALFQLGILGIRTTIAARNWNIKISQISCTSTQLPPQGCTQYFTGKTGTLTTFNFAGGSQLADQKQTICIRREKNNCRLCVVPTITMGIADFAVSGMTASIGSMGTGCCGYGLDPANLGKVTKGWDCLIIPNATKKTISSNQVPGPQFCGQNLITNAAITIASVPVCTRQVPFVLQFLTDSYTFNMAGATGATKGFKLSYTEEMCT